MRWPWSSFETPAASTDGGEEPWVEVVSAPAAKSTAWAPRGLCDRVKRWARTAAVPAVMLAACDVAELPAADEVVQVNDPRTGDWFEAVGAELEVGDTYLDDGRVLRVTEDGVEARGEAAVEDLAEADATWVAEAAHRVPGGDEWVLVLGDADDAGHWRLSEVEPGERFAFQGRVFGTADVDADGDLEVRATDLVLAEVVQTFKRMVVDEVIDLRVAYPAGDIGVITGTREHPFFVPAVDAYVPLGELEPGTVLRTERSGEAVVLDLTWREGEFEVFNIEVAEAHNYFVRAPGFDGEGVLVHNKPMKRATYKDAPYHHSGSKGGAAGGKSRSPSNGQETLDFATEYNPNSSRRLGYDPDNDEIVVFDETSPGEYHGHVRGWGELDQKQQAHLRKELGFGKNGKPPSSCVGPDQRPQEMKR